VSLSWSRVRAIVRKDLREYRHNGSIIATMSILPSIFLINPLIAIFAVPASSSGRTPARRRSAVHVGYPGARASWCSRRSSPSGRSGSESGSRRASDVRVAQQLGCLRVSHRSGVTSLIAYNVIHPTLRLGALLLVLGRLGWRVTSAMFDRERLVTGTKS
jgi:hypothetical protein